MESLEIFQDGTTSGWWVVAHNGTEVYRSDGLHSVISWLRDFSAYANWESVPLYIQPRRS